MRRALIAICSLAMLGGSSTIAAAAQPPADPAGGGQPRMVGYFIQWGIYRPRSVLPQEPDRQRVGREADRHQLRLRQRQAGRRRRTWSVRASTRGPTTARRPAAENSVDGVGDIWGEPLRGHFQQLRKLKALYPDLRVNISLGGWTGSKYFSDACADAGKPRDARRVVHRSVHQGQPAGRRRSRRPGRRSRRVRWHRPRLGVAWLRGQPGQRHPPRGQAELHRCSRRNSATSSTRTARRSTRTSC